ncbi:MAG: carbon starvation protein A [Nitrosomonadales bacterium]|jgi:carbon starvation protein|uniref:Carbon starvation protein CstA n=1 Tax=Methylophilales bacterium HTCC2181 TaxID=383631 RepID=A0P846_9PROT|nr:carbon starvation protein CstA [Methylophilales bacterium HTCC2181]MBT6140998.1 carbon starvation protein A [Nitrosomonadales bacterium]MDC0877017.1 carbon starvation protein A [Methylophilaceae bacterium]
MSNSIKKIVWFCISLLGAFAFSLIALEREESINALWFITAAVCIYMVSYRFYSAWIASKVFVLDEFRQTPAVRLNNGRDFLPTNKWVVFATHFAAIAGPGPLIGPTLAAQFGYLPGTIWILVGAVVGGAVQDMTVLFFSVRRNGKSLGQMAKEELGVLAGIASLIGTFMIMIILIAVLGLIVVNAMKHSPWATSTVAATIPIAMIVGFYMRFIRPGRILEATLLGVFLLLMAVYAGSIIDQSETMRVYFDHSGLFLAWAIIIYGFSAAVLPIWMLLAPRDYLSTFVKLGTVIFLAIAIAILQPEIKMPAITQFVDGSGPIFGGGIFPFVFITIACGAISGFHALISSGTTPKLIDNEKHIPMIGYGGMLLESFVAIMAMVAACVLEPGVFFAINSPAGIVGSEAHEVITKINSWGFAVTVEQMNQLADDVGEKTLFARTGGAPSLAVGMATIFANAFGKHLLAMWYHFAIMFEAVFILTTLDAGTRVGRFMLQDILSNFHPKLGQTSWLPSTIVTSGIVVSCWGYFLYIGVIDPNGGVNILWPLFGIANQMLAAIALSVGTAILIKSGKIRFAWITAIPLAWLLIVTSSASYQKVFSEDVRIGFLSAARAMTEKINLGNLPTKDLNVTEKLIFNLKLDAGITIFLVIILWVVIFDVFRIAIQSRTQRGKKVTNV